MQGRAMLLLLTLVFLMTEVMFAYFVFTKGGEDLAGVLVKTSFFLILILLYSKKLRWAKWMLSVCLSIYGLLCILTGYELYWVFYFIGVFDIFFAVTLHKATALAVYRHVGHEESEKTIDNTYTHLSPSLVRRYKAVLVDGLLTLLVLVVIMLVVQGSELRTPIMLASAFVIMLTYEPLLTTYSRTIGQRLMKIEVVANGDPAKKITLLNAYVRWFIKSLLGWISFITIHFNSQRRAIHDLASDSMVIISQKRP